MAKQVGPDILIDVLEGLRPKGELIAFTPVIGKHGIALGVATANKPGYCPVPEGRYCVETWDEASAEADRLNENELGLSEEAAARIIASSMSAGLTLGNTMENTNMMHLYNEAKEIAQEAYRESYGDFDEAQEFIHQSCDGHEVSIYYHKALQFCAEQDTSVGEEWLEECGGITQPGDSFGQIACRIAFATLYCAALEALSELEEEST